MKNILSTFILSFLCCVPLDVDAQETSPASDLLFTLESVIRQAQDNSISAAISKELAMKDYWDYYHYLAEKGPQLTFNMNPSYAKQTHYVDYSYVSPMSANMLSSDANITYSQQITRLGGYLYGDTRFIWSEYFGDMKQSYQIPRAFGITPARMGYRQELLGWNGLSWQKRIEESVYKTSERRLSYRLLQVAEQAANLYFEYVACEEHFKIYEQNYHSVDTLYQIGQKKLPLTTISVVELRSLELERMNASTELAQVEAMLKNARRELLSFLNIPDVGQKITVQMPELPAPLMIRTEDVIERAKNNNPDILELDDESLRAEYELDRARHQKGLKTGVDISVGISNYGTDFLKTYSEPELFSIAQVTLSVPIFDGGLSKRREKIAESAFKSAELSVKEEKRQLEQTVLSLLNLLESQQLTMMNASEGVKLADDTFLLIRKMYAEGMLDINTYQLALNRKDYAHQLFTNTICSFWSNYYKLSRLTMYDFITDKPL